MEIDFFGDHADKERLIRICSAISYRLGWRIRLTVDSSSHRSFAIGMQVSDLKDKSLIWVWSIEISIPSDVSEREIVEEVFKIIQWMEAHEVEEQFMYNGVRVYDPHQLGMMAENQRWQKATLFKEVMYVPEGYGTRELVV